MIDSSRQRFLQLLSTVGRASLNAMYPMDFEYYMIAVELINWKGDVVDYFVFPVNPSSIVQTEPNIQSIKHTAGGITVINYPHFVAKDITIKGTFGRKFRLLLGQENVSIRAMRFSSSSGTIMQKVDGFLKEAKRVFDPKVKTGYGATKILQSIHNKANTFDEDGKPYRLFLYNPAIGDNFQIKSLNFTLQQDKDGSNMMWNFTWAIKAIAPINYTLGDRVKLLTADVLQRAAAPIVDRVRSAIF